MMIMMIMVVVVVVMMVVVAVVMDVMIGIKMISDYLSPARDEGASVACALMTVTRISS